MINEIYSTITDQVLGYVAQYPDGLYYVSDNKKEPLYSRGLKTEQEAYIVLSICTGTTFTGLGPKNKGATK